MPVISFDFNEFRVNGKWAVSAWNCAADKLSDNSILIHSENKKHDEESIFQLWFHFSASVVSELFFVLSIFTCARESNDQSLFHWDDESTSIPNAPPASVTMALMQLFLFRLLFSALFFLLSFLLFCYMFLNLFTNTFSVMPFPMVRDDMYYLYFSGFWCHWHTITVFLFHLDASFFLFRLCFFFCFAFSSEWKRRFLCVSPFLFVTHFNRVSMAVYGFAWAHSGC